MRSRSVDLVTWRLDCAKMEGGFQVDVILSSLRELQKAKAQNERVLAGEYAKRKQIEAKLEATNGKLIATSEKQNKMKETLQVAELKVAQTQAQAKMFEQLNCERRDKIAQLNSQIAQKNEERQNHMDTYESQMTTLTEMFRTTWQTQSDDAIDLQQAQYGREIDEHTAMVVTNKLQLDKLSTQLEEATVEHNKPTPLEALGGVTEKTWTSTMALFDAEHKDSLAAFRAKQDKDKQHVEQLTAERLKLIKIFEDMQTVVQTQE